VAVQHEIGALRGQRSADRRADGTARPATNYRRPASSGSGAGMRDHDSHRFGSGTATAASSAMCCWKFGLPTTRWCDSAFAHSAMLM